MTRTILAGQAIEDTSLLSNVSLQCRLQLRYLNLQRILSLSPLPLSLKVKCAEVNKAYICPHFGL